MVFQCFGFSDLSSLKKVKGFSKHVGERHRWTCPYIRVHWKNWVIVCPESVVNVVLHTTIPRAFSRLWTLKEFRIQPSIFNVQLFTRILLIIQEEIKLRSKIITTSITLWFCSILIHNVFFLSSLRLSLLKLLTMIYESDILDSGLLKTTVREVLPRSMLVRKH